MKRHVGLSWQFYRVNFDFNLVLHWAIDTNSTGFNQKSLNHHNEEHFNPHKYIYIQKAGVLGCWASGHGNLFCIFYKQIGLTTVKTSFWVRKKSKQRMLLLFFCHWLSTLDWCKCILIIFCPPGPLGGSWGALLYESTNLSMSILIKIQIKLTFIFKWSCLFVLVYQSRTDYQNKNLTFRVILLF